MKPPNRSPKIKICCISSLAEARLASKLGADILGLVGPMPSGPGVIDDDLIAEIAQSVQPSVKTFLLTSETTAEGIIRHHQRTKTTAIQIVDAIPLTAYKTLRAALPGVDLVQVIHVQGPKSLQEAIAIAPLVDALLLDSGQPDGVIKELGGTGRTHDWKISRQIVQAVEQPVFLAGGLNATNVKEAIRQVEPYGLDLCSGVRLDGNLDETKLVDFISRIRA